MNIYEENLKRLEEEKLLEIEEEKNMKFELLAKKQMKHHHVCRKQDIPSKSMEILPRALPFGNPHRDKLAVWGFTSPTAAMLLFFPQTGILINSFYQCITHIMSI